MTKTRTVSLVLLVAFVGFAALAPVADAAPSAECTGSYPADCTVTGVGGVRVRCTDVGSVPDCRT